MHVALAITCMIVIDWFLLHALCSWEVQVDNVRYHHRWFSRQIWKKSHFPFSAAQNSYISWMLFSCWSSLYHLLLSRLLIRNKYGEDKIKKMPGTGDFPAKNVPFPLLFSYCAHTLMQLSQCSLSYIYHCMMLLFICNFNFKIKS